LKTASSDIEKFRTFYDQFEAADESEYEALVVGKADILASPAFFDYIANIAAAAHDDPERKAKIIQTGSRIAAIHEAYARAAKDQQSLTEAAENFHSLLQVRYLLVCVWCLN
jgi:hypothetical protein